MVYYQADPLDKTFAALSDPTRRALLARLEATDGLSISELAKPFAMSLPAVMKHIDVLTDAGLMTRTKIGRKVTCNLNAAAMQAAAGWLNRYARFWNEKLDKLVAFLEEDDPCEPLPQPSNPASPSNGGSTPRPKGSTPPGPNRKK
ncbi:ArsR family transcriptional regulator [Afipia sp. P52-10]|jgi:DNA-binding transcriptional ArsR family regulator|uniref:ArsR/SmtB family transcription factor n=1 Tax=Afipia sp. P52-10 TaxID=1429916 RepID=UPI0003DF423C|nr:helix-turn-helix transcriptional regulator [Afipia sp. P52-10]ETR77096.1 ArsR family transcriptional regulator [Afipia sp. P52-10]